MLTRRGRMTFLFGVTVYVVAWAFGSKSLYPVAVGLVLAVLLAWAWIRLARRPEALQWGSRRREHIEGDEVQIEIEARLEPGRVPPPATLLEQSVRSLGVRRTRLERNGDVLSARYRLVGVPRGRYVLRGARAIMEDPFGLERAEIKLPGGSTLLVYPRLAELGELFSDWGAGQPHGRRLLLRRPSGFDFHSVREYVQGESLRRVHWPSTAKRGELIVKELEDAPRDEVGVLLDAACPSTGKPPDSSFDTEVRAAGSILLAHARRGRRALLAVNGEAVEVVRVTAAEDDRARVLEVLAAAEPNGRTPAAALLALDKSPLSGALELAVVTSKLTRALVDRLVQRTLSHRRTSLVFVDRRSFTAGGGNGREPGLLHLQAAGIPVAVLRRGDDLAAVLGRQEGVLSAHG